MNLRGLRFDDPVGTAHIRDLPIEFGLEFMSGSEPESSTHRTDVDRGSQRWWASNLYFDLGWM